MDEILGQVLRNAVWERLDMLTELANRADAPSLLSVARSELPRLTRGWRAVLAAHEPDERGNCPECSTRWRQQKAPCAVWQAAYEHLVAGGLAPRPARHHREARCDAGSSDADTGQTVSRAPGARTVHPPQPGLHRRAAHASPVAPVGHPGTVR
ncbi:hypothetical protein [Streptoalloteichus tenebrarius]|uniref:hypothetical protein n=1 Tax=Streptoalloteichus tenebrarius (strain ATCC 17920 / DSM 40477 / JCM 4838 / CBS 697.72 / NBRC 16177 / NCIMB 11028 / NRRL B-12390 / A12253. 1 / ISP 5477) TaxID=1933 RepID=UPI0020A5EA98|nr:hypothetical protein [Streptoalloteichus tenebrarius]